MPAAECAMLLAAMRLSLMLLLGTLVNCFKPLMPRELANVRYMSLPLPHAQGLLPPAWRERERERGRERERERESGRESICFAFLQLAYFLVIL
jgi:hypothetical protein